MKAYLLVTSVLLIGVTFAAEQFQRGAKEQFVTTAAPAVIPSTTTGSPPSGAGVSSPTTVAVPTLVPSNMAPTTTSSQPSATFPPSTLPASTKINVSVVPAGAYTHGGKHYSQGGMSGHASSSQGSASMTWGVVAAAFIGGIASAVTVFLACYVCRLRAKKEKRKRHNSNSSNTSFMITTGSSSGKDDKDGLLVETAQFVGSPVEMQQHLRPPTLEGASGGGGFSDRLSEGTIFTAHTGVLSSATSSAAPQPGSPYVNEDVAFCSNASGSAVAAPTSCSGSCSPKPLIQQPSLQQLNAISLKGDIKAQKAASMAAMEEGLLRYHAQHPVGSISPNDEASASLPMVQPLSKPRTSQQQPPSGGALQTGRVLGGKGFCRSEASSVAAAKAPPQMLAHGSNSPSGTTALSLSVGCDQGGMPTAMPSAWSAGINSNLMSLPGGQKPKLTLSQPARLNPYMSQQRTAAPKMVQSEVTSRSVGNFSNMPSLMDQLPKSVVVVPPPARTTFTSKANSQDEDIV